MNWLDLEAEEWNNSLKLLVMVPRGNRDTSFFLPFFLCVWGGHLCKTMRSSKARDSTGWSVEGKLASSGEHQLKWQKLKAIHVCARETADSLHWTQEAMGNHQKAITREMTWLMGIVKNGLSFSEAKKYFGNGTARFLDKCHNSYYNGSKKYFK